MKGAGVNYILIVNPSETSFFQDLHTLLCARKKHVINRFSSNFEAFKSELLKYIEEMFSQYYIYSDKLTCSDYRTHNSGLPVRKGLNKS